MNLSQRDKLVIWHPYTQVQGQAGAIAVSHAEGAAFFDEEGKRYIDAVSSWWTNVHGHAHPYIAAAVAEQLSKLEHILFAGFTHEPAVKLAEMLLERLPRAQQRIFYSDDGSTAVEAALKMALQYWHNSGKPKTKIIAFSGAYHGDTFGAMSVSGRSAFTGAFETLLFETLFIDPPVVGKTETSVQQLRSLIDKEKDKIACFIYEPLLQGTAGMLMHSAEHLGQLLDLCKKNGILTIADEVMTGFGRTGTFFASQQVSTAPDICCLSKGLTGGTMALGITSCTEDIFRAFVSGDRMKTFFHGHSYTANPVACSAAIASLDLFEKENTLGKIRHISEKHASCLAEMKRHYPTHAYRQMGTVLAIAIKAGEEDSYFHSIRDRIYTHFLSKGILLRPLGNVLYLMPPYCISDTDLEYIYDEIKKFLEELKNA